MYLTHRNIFENNECTYNYLYKDNWFSYTRECAFGYISNYPALVYVDTQISKYARTTAEFNILIIKFNITYRECISFTVGYDGLPENLREQVFEFISNIEKKGYPKADISNIADAIDLFKAW